MIPRPQAAADAASDAYLDRSVTDVGSNEKTTYLDGEKYVFFGYSSDPSTGFHGTAYWNRDANNVIVAYRGTDPDIWHHTATTIKGVQVDIEMVRDGVNRQEGAAAAFTEAMIAKAARHGITSDQITVAGHSLGGTLAQIEASKHGLRGATFNAYGAADLGYGVCEGGSAIRNYRMAGDVPSAATHHYGEVISLASDADVRSLKAGRYVDAPRGAPPPNPLLALRLADHDITNFISDLRTGRKGVLEPDVMAHDAQNYANHKQAFDRLGREVYAERAELAEVLRRDSSRNLTSTWANLHPHIRQQATEWHAMQVDASIVARVEHHARVTTIEHALEGGAAAARGAGRSVQALDARVARDVRRSSAYVAPLAPTAPAHGLLLAEAAHLHGETAVASSGFVANQLDTVRHTVEQGAHLAGRGAAAVAHVTETLAVGAADRVFDAGRAVKVTADVVRAGMGVATATALARGDPTQAIGAAHELYQRLRTRVPDAGEQRLLQMTAACHANGMTAGTLGEIHVGALERNMVVLSTSPLVPPTVVDLVAPPPEAARSIEQIQQIDAERQSQVHSRIQLDLQARDLPMQSLALAPQPGAPG